LELIGIDVKININLICKISQKASKMQNNLQMDAMMQVFSSLNPAQQQIVLGKFLTEMNINTITNIPPRFGNMDLSLKQRFVDYLLPCLIQHLRIITEDTLDKSFEIFSMLLNKSIGFSTVGLVWSEINMTILYATEQTHTYLNGEVMNGENILEHLYALTFPYVEKIRIYRSFANKTLSMDLIDLILLFAHDDSYDTITLVLWILGYGADFDTLARNMFHEEFPDCDPPENVIGLNLCERLQADFMFNVIELDDPDNPNNP
jgi:hypothetical protein